MFFPFTLLCVLIVLVRPSHLHCCGMFSFSCTVLEYSFLESCLEHSLPFTVLQHSPLSHGSRRLSLFTQFQNMLPRSMPIQNIPPCSRRFGTSPQTRNSKSFLQIQFKNIPLSSLCSRMFSPFTSHLIFSFTPNGHTVSECLHCSTLVSFPLTVFQNTAAILESTKPCILFQNAFMPFQNVPFHFDCCRGSSGSVHLES